MNYQYLQEFTNYEREISIPHEALECSIENFEFVSEWVQVNPNNSQAMSVLTLILLFKLNTLQKKSHVKVCVSRSHGIMTVVWIYTTLITPRWWRQGGCFVTTQYHMVQISQSENGNSYSVWKLNDSKT